MDDFDDEDVLRYLMQRAVRRQYEEMICQMLEEFCEADDDPLAEMPGACATLISPLNL